MMSIRKDHINISFQIKYLQIECSVIGTLKPQKNES